MKTFFSLFALLISLTSSAFATTATSISNTSNTTKITVNGMVCAFCAQGIEKRVSKMPAAQSVFVDLKSKIVAVEAKAGMSLDVKLLAHEITEAGYDVVKIESSTQSVAEIKAGLKAKK